MIGIGINCPWTPTKASSGGALLSLDMLSMSFAPLGTYTRATGGYTFNSSGILVANTANQPRPDYDPATLSKRGWLMEGSRTNLLKRSEDFTHADWAELVTPTVSGNTAVAPDGMTTADTLTPDATNPSARQLTTVVVGTVYTASVYVKAAPTGSATHFRLTSNNASAWNTGASSKVALTSSWQRVEITWTQATTTSARVICGALTVAGALDSDCYGNVLIWGAQLEAGSFPSSYIPTTTTSASRSADLWTISNAQFLAATGQNIPQAEGTALLTYNAQALYDTNLTVSNMLFINNGGTDHVRIYQYRNRLGIAVTQGGSGTVDHYIGSLTNGVHKVAMRWKANDCNISVDGVASTADATCATMPTTNTISLGVDAFGHLRGVRIYPFAMTDAQLAGITA